MDQPIKSCTLGESLSRWVVERSIASINRCRRLSKDFEHHARIGRVLLARPRREPLEHVQPRLAGLSEFLRDPAVGDREVVGPRLVVVRDLRRADHRGVRVGEPDRKALREVGRGRGHVARDRPPVVGHGQLRDATVRRCPTTPARSPDTRLPSAPPCCMLSLEHQFYVRIEEGHTCAARSPRQRSRSNTLT